MKTYKVYIVSGILLLLIALGWWFFSSPGEFEKPDIKLSADIQAIGRLSAFSITFTDARSGLAQTTVSITQGDKSTPVSTTTYRGKAVHAVTVPFAIDPAALKLHDGPAVLTISASDRSLWKNATTLSKVVTIDVTPPQIFLLTPTNHINPGGTGMIVYRTSKPVPSTGILVGDAACPSYPVSLSGKPAYIAYFAMPIEAGPATKIRIYARDLGGNEAFSGVPYLLLKKKFRSDKMSLSDHFLQQKMPEFASSNPALRDKTPVEVFTYVNSELRAENFKSIQEICRKSEARQLWEGTFLRMKDASPMAQFGDRRTWMYAGKTIGDSFHMGVDLASTANAPIEAANTGVIAFAGPLGIYGNAVVIDHGQGLFTLYGHLADISVKSGQGVNREEVIGRSGLSGLAGGDHLHFSVIAGGQFVNPTEWWDPHWIADNVTKKMAVSF